MFVYSRVNLGHFYAVLCSMRHVVHYGPKSPPGWYKTCTIFKILVSQRVFSLINCFLQCYLAVVNRSSSAGEAVARVDMGLVLVR